VISSLWSFFQMLAAFSSHRRGCTFYVCPPISVSDQEKSVRRKRSMKNTSCPKHERVCLAPFHKGQSCDRIHIMGTIERVRSL
jgi:hypothetical protein